MGDAGQQAKGEKTGDAEAPRFVFHPYFDVFVAEQVVELKLFPPYDKPAFTVSSREGLPEVHGQLVDSHIRELAISERYLHFFRGQPRRLLRLLHGLRDGGKDVRMSLTAFRDGWARSEESRVGTECVINS